MEADFIMSLATGITIAAGCELPLQRTKTDTR